MFPVHFFNKGAFTIFVIFAVLLSFALSSPQIIESRSVSTIPLRKRLPTAFSEHIVDRFKRILSGRLGQDNICSIAVPQRCESNNLQKSQLAMLIIASILYGQSGLEFCCDADAQCCEASMTCAPSGAHCCFRVEGGYCSGPNCCEKGFDTD